MSKKSSDLAKEKRKVQGKQSKQDKEYSNEKDALQLNTELNKDEPYVPRLKTKYFQEIIPALKEKYGYKNIHQVPKFDKVVLNMGVGEGATDSKRVQSAVADLEAIAGQKAVITRAKKDISSFKLRCGMPIGAKVVLRKDAMYEFLGQLASFLLARVRDFRGLNPKSFDGHGNYTIGIKEHFIFPTINYDKSLQDLGMDATICTTALTDDESCALMCFAGFPFRR